MVGTEGDGARRRLAAIMFTDMVGYSALAQHNEALALVLVGEQQRLLRPIIAQHGGREVKGTGDGFLVEFASALQAMSCAVDMQNALVEYNASGPTERNIHIRIGLHLGDVVVRDGDVFGDGVNIAARIEPLAEPGGVCISGAVYEQVHNKIDLPLVRLPKPALKNIHEPIDVYRLVMPWEPQVAPARPPRRMRVQARARAAAAALLLAAVLAGTVWWLSTRPPTARPPQPEAGLPPTKKSVAVLPFVNMSSDKENEYFSDGITEDLITALSKVSGLHVAARTSSFAFKGKNEDVRTIGAQLNVGAVLEGSVSKAGNRVRITAQLTNTADGYHMWSDSYDRELQDIFAIRSQVAQTVAQALQVALVADERQRLEHKPTEDVEAYQLYLKGRQAAASYADYVTARRYLQQAIARDPNYALAYVGLAYCYMVSLDWPKPAYELLPRIREAADEALRLDPSLAEAHVWLGYVRWMYEYDLAAARHELQTAVTMQPDLVYARAGNGWYLVAVGEPEAGLIEARRAVELDPLSHEATTILGFNLYFARRYDAAIQELRNAVAVNPDFYWAHLWLGRALARTGKASEALAELRTAQQLDGTDSPEVESAVGRVYADAGDETEARKVLTHLRERAREEYIAGYFMATLHVGLGEVDEAFAALTRAVEQRAFYLGWLKVDPDLDPLRSDRRFAELLKKVGMDK